MVVLVAVAVAACAPIDAPGEDAGVTPSVEATTATSAPSASPTGDPSAPTGPSAPQPSAAAAPGTALAMLEGLRVAGRGPKTGYSREAFGTPWLDVDRNGCDTRNDILTRDLRERVYRSARSCAVISGILDDPYTARTITFVRGGPSEVDIDHVVALGNAWVTGAARFTERQRVLFANDPLNLLAVDAGANRQKGDADAATWLPPNRSFRCAYVARQIAVKDSYGLAVTPPEREAMIRVLERCPGQPAVT